MTLHAHNNRVAVRVCEAFISSDLLQSTKGTAKDIEQIATAHISDNHPKPFIYVSAEDIFRPLIPARYISTKREAEQRIEELIAGTQKDRFRGVYIRPS